MTSRLCKNLKITEESHEKLSRAKLELHGSEAVSFSDVIEELAEDAINRGGN